MRGHKQSQKLPCHSKPLSKSRHCNMQIINIWRAFLVRLTVIEKEIVRHPYSVRLHRVTLSVVIIADIAVIVITDLLFAMWRHRCNGRRWGCRTRHFESLFYNYKVSASRRLTRLQVSASRDNARLCVTLESDQFF